MGPRWVTIVAIGAVLSTSALAGAQVCEGSRSGRLDAMQAGATKIEGAVWPPTTRVTVVVQSGDARVQLPVAAKAQDQAGAFSVATPFALATTHTVSLVGADNCTLVDKAAVEAKAEEPGKRLSTEWTRLAMGIESSGRAAQARNWNYLLDFMLTGPAWNQPVCGAERIEVQTVSARNVAERTPSAESVERLRTSERKLVDCTRKLPRLGVFLNARLSGVPQDGSVPVEQFVGGFSKKLVGGSTSDILRGLQLVVGGEVALNPNGWKFDDRYALQPFLVVAGGFTSAPNPSDFAPVFKLNAAARERYGVPASTEERTYQYIAFVQPDRDTLFGQWYVGLRLKTHHFVSADSTRRINFPGMVDLTVGQNAAVQGGKMTNGPEVFRLEAFYPLPIDRARSFYLFGTVLKRLRHGTESPALILEGATAALSGDDVFQYDLTPADRRRDFWSFGFGVDLINLFTKPEAEKN